MFLPDETMLSKSKKPGTNPPRIDNRISQLSASQILLEMVRSEVDHWKPSFSKFYRFLSVGVLTFSIDYGLYCLFTELINTHITKLPTINTSALFVMANIISCTSGFLFSFFWNRNFVFKVKGKLQIQFIRYLLLFVANLFWGNLLLYLAIKTGLLSALYAKALLMCVTTLVNFMVYKNFVYKAPIVHEGTTRKKYL